MALNLSLLTRALYWLLLCGDVESNPGPTNFEYKALRSCGVKIVQCLASDPNNVALQWFTKDLISSDVYEETTQLNETKTGKAHRLYQEVLNLVDHSPDKYHMIVKSFEGQELFSDLTELLNKKYGELSGADHSEEERMDQSPAQPLPILETSGMIRSDSLATSDYSSPPTSPLSFSSASSPSSSLTGFTKANRDERLNSVCTKNEIKVKRNFTAFVNKVKIGFATIDVDRKAIEDELKYIYPKNADIFGPENDVASIIGHFVMSHEWDYWNCDHLCEIVNDYGNKEMKKAEKEYRQQLEHFHCTTKLSEYLSSHTGALSRTRIGSISSKSHWKSMRRSSGEYRDQLSFKIKVDISSQTLKYIEDLWKRTHHRGLPKVGVVLDNICSGCVEVFWIILRPNIAIEFRKKAIEPDAIDFYKENKIIRVVLNEDCLYSTDDVTSSITSDMLKLPTSESIEEEPEDLGVSEPSAGVQDEETPTTEGHLETDEGDEVKSKEEIINEEPVKSKPAKEKLSKLLGKITKTFRKSVSEKLLAECSSKKANIEVVRSCLEQKDCNVNIRQNDKFRWSPLMWACENKHFEIGRLLLKYKPQVDIQDKKEWSPLVLASIAGDLEIVQGIVELGAEIDSPTNRKWTPLMWAAQEGHVEVAGFLLGKGAFVDYPDENGWTPLMQASQEGHVDMVNLLLDYGAKIDYQTKTAWCALMAATKNKRSAVVDTLSKRGAQVDIEREDGTTALQVASFYENNSEVTNTLIKHRANVDHQSKDGMTALMLATNKGHLELVQDLVEGGADIDKQHPAIGWTAIFFAAKSGNMAIFRWLLHKGAKTEIDGRNVIDVASLFNRKKMVSELKTFQQAPHRIISSSVNPPTLEPAESAPIKQEISTTTEHKIEIRPEATKPQDIDTMPTPSPDETQQQHPQEEKIQGPVEELTREPPKLSDLEEMKPESEGSSSSPSTIETKVGEVDTASTDSLPAVETNQVPAAQVEQPVTMETSKTKSIETKKSEQKLEAKKSLVDIKQEAIFIDRLLKHIDNTIGNPYSNVGRKGISSVEDFAYTQTSRPATQVTNTPEPTSWTTEDDYLNF